MSEPDKQTGNIKVFKGNRGGYRPGAGRPKGSANRLTRTLRQSIEDAYDRLGGAEWLVRVAEEDPRAFIALLGRAMPPSPRDPEENADLAERMASARDRIQRLREAERENLRSLSDEQLAQKLEEALRELRGSPGNPCSSVLTDALRRSLTEKREVTLEELLEMTWSEPRSTARIGPSQDSEELEEPKPAATPSQRPAPVVKPVSLAIHDVLPAQDYEQLPGQAVNSHRRHLGEDSSSSSGMTIHDYDPLAGM